MNIEYSIRKNQAACNSNLANEYGEFWIYNFVPYKIQTSNFVDAILNLI